MRVLGFYSIVIAGYHLWRASFYNYAVDGHGFTADELGLVFALASLPGLLAAGVGRLSQYLPLYALISLAAGVLGLGLVALSLAETGVHVALAVLAVSIGFTVFYPAVHDLRAESAPPCYAAPVLGALKCAGALAAALVAALLSVRLIGGHLHGTLAIAGVAALLAGVLLARDARGSFHGGRRGRLRLMRSMWPYYGLNFLAGARSVLFKTLVLVQLVSKFEFSAADVALVLLIGHLASTISYRSLGWLAARLPASTLLAWLYGLAGIVFIGFEHVGATGFVALILADSLLFGVSTVTDAHLRVRCPERDFLGQLSVGISCFHLAGVLVPSVLALFMLGEDTSILSIAGVMLALAGIGLSRLLHSGPPSRSARSWSKEFSS